jgi:hypothetical protein
VVSTIAKWRDKLLYGPVAPYRGSDAVVYEPTPQPLRTSWVFDSHVVTEASGGGGRGKTPKSTSLAYAENDAWGQENIMRSFMGLTPRERKETLLAIFLANPWASNCIDTIALYIVSGGMTIEPRVPNPDKSQRKKIEELLLRINEDWDFNQYVYDSLTDQDIFGETFTEYTMYGGAPYQLFSTDCITMDAEHDKFGRAVRYKQQLNLTTEVNYLDKNTIIRWWNPHKRAKVDPFSPLERVQDAILLDKKMVNWSTTFFQKGAKFPYWVEFQGDQDEAERYLTWFKQNYTGEKNAHLPPVAYNGAKFHEFGSGAVDIDFESGLNRQQTIVLSAFHVPPSIACIAESGNRLTDMSDGQRKILQYIACDPRRHRFFEKFNYRLIFPYFGNDYYVSTRYADFRDDKSLAEVADIRVRNGSLKINEARQEMGRDAYTDGGDVPVIVTTKEVTPVPRLDDLETEQRTTAKQTLDQGDLNTEMLKAKVEQAKNPPPPIMPPQSPSNGKPPVKSSGGGRQQPPKQQAPKNANKRDKQESAAPSFTRDNLTQSLRTLFTEVEQRAASHVQKGKDPSFAYDFTTEERTKLISQLAYGYREAIMQAYTRAAAVAHLHPSGIYGTRENIRSNHTALPWAEEQAHSIIGTYREQVAKFVSESHAEGNLNEGLVHRAKEIIQKVASSIADFLSWKIPQIVNVAWMTGTNEGTDQAVQDILDEATTPDGSDIPVQNMRVRVLPMESSNDLCAEWAGRDFDLTEYDDIPDFPIHPGCPHYKELYDAGGEE